MKIGKTLYVDNRKDWRKWLRDHFQTDNEIWLVFPRKHSGKPAIVYNDAVEEALCFGWIDSIRKKLDEDHSVQRYSPRKPRSNWSQQNIERVRWLLENGLVHESLVAQYQQVAAVTFEFPEDILARIQQNETAWQNYQNFSPAYKRIRIAYIESGRRRPDEFEKRLKNLIAKTEAGKMIGYGGIDKYY
ncbi:MAG TPA: YdeI/OmpD-associated family protein [Anaerolineales bacterium]|nr:YdeI/OmpD-associated family protein [Anaerolineales bacterium]